MTSPRRHRKDIPPALAVLSCTLALLAAQPAAARASIAAPVTMQQVEQLQASSTLPANSKSINATARTKPHSIQSAASHTHGITSARHHAVMMSLYVLQHVLAGKLSPSAPLLFASPISLCDASPVIDFPVRPIPTIPYLSSEKQFLLTHSLLAPPV